MFFGDRKFWTLGIVDWGFRNSGPFLVFFGDRKFWTLGNVDWGIRNSGPFLVLIGGSEILNPFKYSLRDLKFRTFFNVD